MNDIELIKERVEFNPENLITRIKAKYPELEEEPICQIILDNIYIILNFTNQDKVHEKLERTLYSMCIDYYKLLLKSDEKDNKIKSTTRGDFKVEFLENTEIKRYVESQILTNYSNVLVEFRKMRN